MDVDNHSSITNQPLRFTTTGLVVEGNSPVQRLIRFIDTILRGVG